MPVIYWPFFAVQQTSCRYTCTAWEMGLEVSADVKRDEVEGLVKKILDREEGMKMRAKAKEWKNIEAMDIQGQGSSNNNFERLIEALQCGKVRNKPLVPYGEVSNVFVDEGLFDLSSCLCCLCLCLVWCL